MSIWNPEDFTEGGFKGIKKIEAVLQDLEDGVEGKYGDQIRFDFVNVSIVESEEPVKLNDNELTEYIKESQRTGSVNQKMVLDWTAVAKELGVGPIPSCFKGVPMIWEHRTYDFGEGMSPGMAYVPVSFLDGAFTGGADPEGDMEIPDALRDKIIEVLGTEGATLEMVQASVVKKKTTREPAKALGGIETVLAELVASETLAVDDDGLFTVA